MRVQCPVIHILSAPVVTPHHGHSMTQMSAYSTSPLSAFAPQLAASSSSFRREQQGAGPVSVCLPGWASQPHCPLDFYTAK